MQARLDERVYRRVRGVRRRQQLRMGLRHVVALHEGRGRQFPVHRQQARLPPLDAQRLHVPFVMPGREGLDTVAQQRRIVVEVDPGAPAPQLAPDRGQAQIVGTEVAFVENLWPQYEGAGTVETPTPAVERADEVAARPAALDELHSAVAT